MLVTLPKQSTESNSEQANSAFLARPVSEKAVASTDFLNAHELISNLSASDHQVEAQACNQALGENNQQRFSHLLSIMPAGVLVVDKKGNVTLANEQATKLLGQPIIGQAWRSIIARVFAPKADDGHEVSMRNGKRVKIDISPLTQEKGQLIVVTDLTETRQLQSRVGHMQRLSSLGKMVASLAHQVRTPLSSALLYAENLKSMPLQNEMASRFSEKLTLRLKELESQVNDMLLFAKSSDKQIVSNLSTSDILNQAIEQMDAQLEQAGMQLRLFNPEPQAFVLGNITAITGAITNLITNAMQALANSKQAMPCVELHLAYTQVQNVDYAVFTVSDNGAGIAEDTLKQLFEPFFTTKSQGTGLGLAVVNTVAKSHKGFVKCGNNQTQGAYFALYLPINKHSEAQLNQQSGVDHEQD